MYSKMTSKKEYSKDTRQLEKYIEGMATGSKECLINFYEATKTDIYSFALSILKNKENAEDVFQEVYIKAYENAASYQAYGKPLAWVLTIAKNLCFMKIRCVKDDVDIDEIYDLKGKDKTDSQVENKLILDFAFKYISDEDRNIVILHTVSGLKHREIAKILGLSVSTVLSKYSRAIGKLRKVIGEDMI